MSSSLRRLRTSLGVCLLTLLATCGGQPPSTLPTQPTPPAAPPPGVTVASVQVGTAGNASTTVAPGDKLQLFAQAVNSDGSVADVTNVALWQSSNPVVATVSPAGLVTAAAEGSLDISASYASRSGSLHADVQNPGCRVTLSPASLVFGALEGGGFVTVTTTLSSCRWTARSDASWLSFRFDPNRSGGGNFSYSVPGNNNPSPRDANIIVSVEGGPAAIHAIHQERPVGCVYTVTPEKLTFGAAGGTGSFTVKTIPGDCQWKMTDTWSSVQITGPTTGTGAATVTYTVAPNGSVFDRPFFVRGLSGLNPPATHTVSIVR
jgi:hypothetical protein